MSMSEASGKWIALETDSQNFHRCKQQQQQQIPPTTTATASHKIGIITGGNESGVIEKTPPKMVESEQIAVRHTNEEKIFELDKRLLKLERVIKSMIEGYQSQ